MPCWLSLLQESSEAQSAKARFSLALSGFARDFFGRDNWQPKRNRDALMTSFFGDGLFLQPVVVELKGRSDDGRDGRRTIDHPRIATSMV